MNALKCITAGSLVIVTIGVCVDGAENAPESKKGLTYQDAYKRGAAEAAENIRDFKAGRRWLFLYDPTVTKSAIIPPDARTGLHIRPMWGEIQDVISADTRGYRDGHNDAITEFIESQRPPDLIATIKDRNQTSADRYRASWLFAANSRFDDKEILPLLKSDDASTRGFAVEALRGGGATEVPELLRIVKENSDTTVRIPAIRALGLIRDSRAAPALLNLAETQGITWETRMAVVGSLALIGDPSAVPLFARIVRREIARTAGSIEPWQSALKGLCVIGNADAAKAIAEAANASGNPEVAGLATSMLGELKNPDGLEELGRLAVERTDDLAVPAIRGLGNFQNRRAVEILKAAYRSRNRPPLDILESLGKTQQKAAVPMLLSIALDDRRNPRLDEVRTAIRALGRIGKPAVPALLDAWKNRPDFKTRSRLIDAMRLIGDKRLLQVWKELFDKNLTEARHEWDRGSPIVPMGTPSETVRTCLSGLEAIGPDALPYLKELAQQETHEGLRESIRAVIAMIEELDAS